jgi:uncharacterized protein (DUF433 family)
MTPGVVGGKPRIAGRGISVQHIAINHERMGLPVSEIVDHYDLSFAEVYAALTYYFDNRDEIDEAIRRSEAYVAEMRRQTPSLLDRKFRSLDA